jgi:signal transduction histidine kinase
MDRAHPKIMSRVCQTLRAELHTQESYLDDPASLDPGYVRMVKDLGPRSIIIAPLVSRGRTLGILSLARTRSGAFDEDDLRLAEELGARAGLHIDNAQLYRQAQQAIQARDDLMSIVAHDLRNPLNTIGLHTQLLLQGLPKTDANADLREAATSIKRGIASMAKLIGDLFDAARRDSGQLVQGTRPCDPAQLVTEAVENARALAESKGLVLRSVIASELPAVRADRERIDQVLANLLGNAIKFTPSGGSITVAVERDEHGVAFTVSDTGAGIAPENLPRIIDRFWQGDRTDRRGAGLGLWICSGIVKSHGGSLLVESTLGQGSRFRFNLPASE